MTERRFTEGEVAEIFERATRAEEPGRAPLAAGGALTLAQLQEIGRDVGIAPERVAAAADSLDDRAPTVSRRVLGLPLGVERTIALKGRLSDDEWERVVADLREVFEARGRLARDGSLRQWTNGNLHALLEPTAAGQRLRLRTVKGNAPGMLTLGLGTVAASGALAAANALTGAGGAQGALGFGVLALAGVALSLGTALRLPGWARRRRTQMDEIAARVAEHASERASEQRALPSD